MIRVLTSSSIILSGLFFLILDDQGFRRAIAPSAVIRLYDSCKSNIYSIQPLDYQYVLPFI